MKIVDIGGIRDIEDIGDVENREPSGDHNTDNEPAAAHRMAIIREQLGLAAQAIWQRVRCQSGRHARSARAGSWRVRARMAVQWRASRQAADRRSRAAPYRRRQRARRAQEEQGAQGATGSAALTTTSRWHVNHTEGRHCRHTDFSG